MDSKTKIILAIVLMILLFGLVGIAVFLSLIKSPELPIQNISRTTTISIICSKPYVVIGNRCCADNNNNSICDIDEITTTIIVEITTTTTKTTTTTIRTTTSTTTTTTIPIRCYYPSDCGNSSVEYRCIGGNVYKISKIPICHNEGTPESYCTTIVSRPTLIAQCKENEVCVEGLENCQRRT